MFVLAVVTTQVHCSAPDEVAGRADQSEPAAESTASGPRNLLLVTFDTTRADRLGCSGWHQAGTPHLDQLASQGARFVNAQAVAPITLPSHASVMTGLYPRRHGARTNGLYSLADEHRTLAEILRDNGYQTGAVIGAFVLDARFGLAQGFATYDDELSGRQGDPLLFAERSAAEVTDRARRMLPKLAGGPFFLWVHYFDPHSAYSPPAPFAERFESDPYQGEIAYADHELGRLLDGLARSGVEARTVVSVIGDHGEALHEHGEPTHGFLLHDETLRVPWLLKSPGQVQPGLEVARLVSQVDVLPTILRLLDIEPPAEIDGVDALPPASAASRTVFAETYHGLAENGWAPLFAALTESFKLIEGPQPELYDVVADPAEIHNRLEPGSEAALRLRRQLQRHFGAELEQQQLPVPNRSVSAAELENLEALGYRLADPPQPTGDRPDPKRMLSLMAKVDQAVFSRSPQERDQAVIEELEAVVLAHPRFVPAHRYLGLLKMQHGDPAGAEAALETALALHPDSADLRLALARSRARQGRLGEAVTDLTTSTARFPDHAESHLALSRYLHQNGDLEAAEHHIRRAFDLQPDLEGCADTLQRILRANGHGDALFAVLHAALERKPASTEIRRAIAMVLMASKRVDAAEKVLRDGLALAPNNTAAAANLAELLVSRANATRSSADEALLLLQRAGATTSRDAGVLLILSQVYGAQGRVDDAISTCEQAVDLAERTAQHFTARRSREYLNRLYQARQQMAGPS